MPPATGCVNWIGNEGRILFHFNPRVAENEIVMNSQLGASWGPEERIKLPTGSTFKVKVTVDDIGYHVFLNGSETEKHVFKHREDFSTFTSMNCTRYTAELEPEPDVEITADEKGRPLSYFKKRVVVSAEEQKTQAKSVYMLISTTISMFSATIQVLDPLQQKEALKNLSSTLLEIFASVITQDSTLLGQKDENIWRPLTQMLPGSPLAIAIGKIESLMIKNLSDLLTEQADELSKEAARAEVTFLLAISIFQNSLAGILRVLEFLLKCSWLSLLGEIKDFLKIISTKDFDISQPAPVVALTILERIYDLALADDKLFPVCSIEDAGTLIHWVSTFGLIERETTQFPPNTFKISKELCSLAAKFLKENITRIIPTVDIEKRFDILGELGATLKSSIDHMVMNDERDPLHGIFLYMYY